MMQDILNKLQRYWHAIPVLGRFFIGVGLIVLLILGRLPVFLAVPLLLLAVVITGYSGYQFLLANTGDISEYKAPDDTKSTKRLTQLDDWDDS